MKTPFSARQAIFQLFDLDSDSTITKALLASTTLVPLMSVSAIESMEASELQFCDDGVCATRQLRVEVVTADSYGAVCCRHSH